MAVYRGNYTKNTNNSEKMAEFFNTKAYGTYSNLRARGLLFRFRMQK
jgi:hypothetical protein